MKQPDQYKCIMSTGDAQMKMQELTNRPKVQMPPFSPLELVLIWGTVLLLLSLFWSSVAAWLTVTDRIVTQFDAAGNPQSWGSKNTLLILPGVSLALGILFSIGAYLPRYCNYPCKVTEQNAQKLYGLARQLLLVIGTITIFLMWFISRNIVQSSLTGRFSLNPIWIIASVVLLTVTCVFYTVRMIRAGKETPQS